MVEGRTSRGMAMADNNSGGWQRWRWQRRLGGRLRRGRGRTRAGGERRGDSKVVMMAAAAEDGGGRQWRQRQTIMAVDDNGTQDRAAYNGEGQEWVARDGGDRGVAIMAAAAEDGGGGQQRRKQMRTATADDDSGGQQRQQRTTASKIRRQAIRGKDKSRWQTTTALGIRLISQLGSRAVKKNKFMQKDFFQQYSLFSWKNCSCQNRQSYVLSLPVFNCNENC
jgi:hypothetical protein